MFKKTLILIGCTAIIGCNGASQAKKEVAKINANNPVEFSSIGNHMVSQIKKEDKYYTFGFDLPRNQLPEIYTGTDNLSAADYSCSEVGTGKSVCKIKTNSLEYTLIDKKTNRKETLKISTAPLTD